MALANCPRCGSLFNKIGLEFCKSCYDEEEKLLRETQEYLRQHRKAPILEVVEAIGLEQWMLDKWIEEKSITFQDPSEQKKNLSICSNCGREITAGQILCKTCQYKQLTNAQNKRESEQEKKGNDEKSQPSGMFIKHR